MASFEEPKRFRLYMDDLIKILHSIEKDLSSSEKYKNANASMYLGLGKMFLTGLDDNTLIDKFTRSQPYWKFLINKDTESLIEQSPHLLNIIPIPISITQKDIREVLESNIIPKTTMDSLWVTLHRMIKVTIKFIVNKRKDFPKYLPNCNIPDECSRWNIKL